MSEYEQALQAAVRFDVNWSLIEVKGSDAAAVLNNFGIADSVNLPVDHAAETFFCDHRGKCLFQAILMRWEKDYFTLLDWAGRGEKLMQHLDRYIISEDAALADISSAAKMRYVVGPRAGLMVRSTLENDRLSHDAGSTISGVARHDFLDLPGFVVLGDHSIDEVPVASQDVFETLRVEAGTPMYGIDIDENRFVMEVAGSEKAVCYTKGCFLGQEPIVMSRDRAGGPNRLFVGMQVNSKQGQPFPGFKVFQNGPTSAEDVGIVTSTAFSPRLGMNIGLGYIRRKSLQEKVMLWDEGGVAVHPLSSPPWKGQDYA